MAELSVAIVGLGRLGASVGLALRRYAKQPNAENQFSVVGADRLASVEQEAVSLGAVERTAPSTRAAVQDKDLIVLAVPYADVRATLRDIADSLRENAVVLDFSPLKLPSMQWAAEILPQGVHLVGATAVVNPAYLWDGLDDTEHACADYFDNGALLLAPAATTNRDAIALVSTLAAILGAGVHYIDPAEHDGLAGAAEGIPALLSVAAFRALSSSDGWDEMQRLTNPAFGRLTHHLMDTHPDDLRDLLLNNADNTVRYLDAVMAALGELRDVLADGDRDAIEAATVDAETRYANWIRRRSQGKWDDMLDQARPEGTSILTGMLGGFLTDRLFGNKRDDDKK